MNGGAWQEENEKKTVKTVVYFLKFKVDEFKNFFLLIFYCGDVET